MSAQTIQECFSVKFALGITMETHRYCGAVSESASGVMSERAHLNKLVPILNLFLEALHLCGLGLSVMSLMVHRLCVCVCVCVWRGGGGGGHERVNVWVYACICTVHVYIHLCVYSFTHRLFSL